MASEKRTGHLAALLTILIWGTTFISTKILLINFQPVEILFFRFIMGYLVLLIAYPHHIKRLSRKQEITFAAAGFCGVCLYYLLENVALTYTMASNVGVIISVAPFITAILAHLFIKSEERLRINFFVGFIVAMAGIMIDSCICLYFSPQFHMLHTERCSARRKTGCHHPWKLRFLWLCSHGLRYTGRPVYSSYSFHTSYLFSFLPCLVSTGGAVPVDAFSGVSAIRHSPPHHNPGCALHHILAPQCPNHIQ